MATRKTKTQWLALFAEQENSGLSAAEFCRNHNLSEAYFYLKRKKLQQCQQSELSTFVKATPEAVLPDSSVTLQFGQCQLYTSPNRDR